MISTSAPAVHPQPEPRPWRLASTWRRVAAGMLLDRPYLDASICGTEQEYIDARGGGGWRWQADVTFDSMRAAMLQHLGADGFRWSKPGLLRVVVSWLVLLMATSMIVLAVGIRANSHDISERSLYDVISGIVILLAISLVATRFVASIVSLQLLRHATVQHMVACAWLREHAARLEQPLAVLQAQQSLQMHAVLAYLQELQRRAATLRTVLTPFAPTSPLSPSQTLLCTSAKQRQAFQASALAY